MEKVLLHACCAVCAAYPIQKLTETGYDPIVCFYNPNIFPATEYNRRRDELIKYCEKESIEYIIKDYEPEKWKAFVAGLENEPEKGLRCDKCFEMRLEKTAQIAVELGIENFTTTLSVSPHKVSKSIFSAGRKMAEQYGLNFLETDFKKENGFSKTMQIAKLNNFYRQDYCGCEFSIRNN